MIGADELLDWTKAEPEEIDNLKALERAAVAYISEPGGRYFGATAIVSERHVWRGGVIQLYSEPTGDDYFELEELDGSVWTGIAEDQYVRDGRLLYLQRAGTWATGIWPRTVPVHFRVTYQAGYDAHAEDSDIWDAPEDIKQAVRMLVMDWYENPAGVTTGTVRADVAASVQNILRKYQ